MLKVTAWIALACFAGCKEERAVRSANVPAIAATPVHRSEPLPELQRARLAYLFEAIERTARAWPQPKGDDELCLLLLAETAQWGVNCPEAPSAAFERTPDTFRGKPVFSRSGGQFDRSGRSLSIPELLASMPAAAHVDEPGARGSDLPARYPWLLLGSLEGLMAHHPAFEGASTEEWLSVALHEVEHTRQLRMPGFERTLRAINEKSADPRPLAALYREDPAYRLLVEREYQQLVAAAWNADATAADAHRALGAWHALYLERAALLAKRPNGAALLHADRLFTYIEGVARYVESQFLVDARQHPAKPLANDPSFRAYARFAGRGYPGMPNKQMDDEYYYALGFHLSVLLERVDPNWRSRVHAQPDWVIGTVRALL